MIIVMKEHIHIFDTTLRDGEQCPGAAMNVEQKIQVAMQLETLGVDIIEAGFPVISDGDFRAVRAVAECTEKSRVCGLARCVEKDIIAAHEALKAAGERERIHLVVATSPIHRKYKLGKSREQIRDMAVKSVAMASDLCGEVQFSAEDASRTEPEFLAEIVESVIDAGAAVINIPDTVGYTMPEEIGWGTTELPLTKHSGRHAVNMRLNALGLSVPDTDMPRLFELFKKRGDQCKFVYDDDLAALVNSL